MTGEHATPEGYARSFDQRLATLQEAAGRCRGFARRLADAGLAAEDLRSVAALDRIPILGKDELLERQQSDPPFAGLLADGAPVRRIFQSPGPLYEAELDEPDPWRWAPALRAASFGSGDTVLNCFGYHLSPAGAMFEQACRVLGARVVPAGIGNADLQVQACADLGVTAFIGLPSYLKALLERADAMGAGKLALEKAFVTAEPLPPSLRGWLTERVPIVRQGYGTAETGNLGYEAGGGDGFVVPSDALVQICDLTSGEAVYDGREGQVVVTLFNPHYPLVRFGTGDLSAWARTDPGQADPAPRIRGWLGRVGDAIKVRGMFLHPRQVGAVMEGFPEVARYRFTVEREQHRDELRCELLPAPGAATDGLAERVQQAIRSGLRFAVPVAIVDALPEEGGVIDDRRTWE